MLEQDRFDAVILVDGGEEVQIEVELAMRERRSRKRHWFVHKVMSADDWLTERSAPITN